tara:strand:+ start:1835 stop:2530 length:696 start_codon:yes stop_codon:yes gene_type:complete
MHTTKTIGWMLVVGVILSLVGLANPAATADWSNDSEVIKALGGNVDLVALTFIISAIGQIIMVMGYAGIRESMTDGMWKTKMQIGVMLALTAAVINVAWSGLMAGTGEAAATALTAATTAAQAAAAGNAAVAEAAAAGAGLASSVAAMLYSSAKAVSFAGNALLFVGVSLIGLGMMMGKAVNNIIALVVGVLGIVGIAIVLYDNNSQLLFIPFMGTFLMSLIIGVNNIRQS